MKTMTGKYSFYEEYPVKMEVFLVIMALIGFGIEEIFHEQHETEKRIRDNLKIITKQEIRQR